MTVSELVIDSYLCYKGKVSSAPVAGSEKYNRIILIANRKQREWSQDTNIDWPQLFQIRPLGNLTTGTQTYDLDDDIVRPSDYINLTLNGQVSYVAVVKARVANLYTKAAYVSGFNPKQLTFTFKIDANYSGSAITLPCYVTPPDLKTGTQRIMPEHSRWLVYAVAAELARNDFSKEEQYSNLIGQANDLYAKMVEEAQNNSFAQPNGVINLMPQVSSLEYNQFTGYGVN